MVPETLGSPDIYSAEQFLNLVVAEGRNDLSRWSWNLHPVKGIIVNNALGGKPGEKDSKTAQVAVDGVSGETLVLDMVKTVIGKASFLLEVENERPDFMLSYLESVRALFSRNKEVEKVAYAAGDDSRGVRAFPFGGCAKLVTMKQSSYIGARI